MKISALEVAETGLEYGNDALPLSSR